MTLQEMRNKAGLSQAAVAEYVGETSQGAVSQWENGECMPRIQKVPLLAKLYGVTEGEIIQAADANQEATK